MFPVFHCHKRVDSFLMLKKRFPAREAIWQATAILQTLAGRKIRAVKE